MKIYNSLTRTKETFVPIEEGKVGIYACGPTVYNYIHIGNARPLVVFDTLRRYMASKGYDVKFVVNFTDVDDKIINRAADEGVDFTEISETYIRAYEENAHDLNLLESETIHPRATQYIEEMVEFIQGLIDIDAAYNVDGNVYFDISKADDYGKLSKKNIEELQAGARIDVADEKRNPLDFALWKKRKEASEPAWPSPWSMGRPGWHIECSVMSKSILGETIDIHAGGEDLQFPHHENEIAQSETLSGETFANYWMHNGMITVDQQKMSKSKGNFFTLHEVAEEYDLIVVRMWLLSAHYRNPINYSREVLDQTKASLVRMMNAFESLDKVIEKAEGTEMTAEEAQTLSQLEANRAQFDAHMDDDLNTAGAMSELFEGIRFANTHVGDESTKAFAIAVRGLLKEMTDVLGLRPLKEEADDDLAAKVEALLAERQEARKAKDFARADAIRDELAAMNVEIKDTREGTTWHVR